MKKTLVALAVTAFATSASALTVYENEGSKVDFDGSIRVLLDNSGSKSKTYDKVTGQVISETKAKRNHSNLHNDGSRFGVKVNHNLADDLFAFGRLEFRFNGGNTSADKFGDLYAHRAYVGLGSKAAGEISFGRQVTIADDISQAGFDNSYGVLNTPLTTSGKSVVRYDYKGVDGLQVGVDYRFAEDRGANGEVVGPISGTTPVDTPVYDSNGKQIGTYVVNTPDSKKDQPGKLKSGYGVGAVYSFDIAEGQSAKVAAGYTRDNYATGTNTKHHRDAYMIGAKYSIDALTVAADLGFLNVRNDADRKIEGGLHLGAKYQFTPEVAAYTNYAYIKGGEKEGNKKVGRTSEHRVMLGAEYKLHKNVLTFVEGSIKNHKTYTAKGTKTGSTRDTSVGVGLRVFW